MSKKDCFIANHQNTYMIELLHNIYFFDLYKDGFSKKNMCDNVVQYVCSNQYINMEIKNDFCVHYRHYLLVKIIKFCFIYTYNQKMNMSLVNKINNHIENIKLENDNEIFKLYLSCFEYDENIAKNLTFLLGLKSVYDIKRIVDQKESIIRSLYHVHKEHVVYDKKILEIDCIIVNSLLDQIFSKIIQDINGYRLGEYLCRDIVENILNSYISLPYNSGKRVIMNDDFNTIHVSFLGDKHYYFLHGYFGDNYGDGCIDINYRLLDNFDLISKFIEKTNELICDTMCYNFSTYDLIIFLCYNQTYM